MCILNMFLYLTVAVINVFLKLSTQKFSLLNLVFLQTTSESFSTFQIHKDRWSRNHHFYVILFQCNFLFLFIHNFKANPAGPHHFSSTHHILACFCDVITVGLHLTEHVVA